MAASLFCPIHTIEIKNRISLFAKSNNQSTEEFSLGVFGYEEHLKGEVQIVVSDLVLICGNYPQLNMNWVLTGQGKMLISSSEQFANLMIQELRSLYKKNRTSENEL